MALGFDPLSTTPLSTLPAAGSVSAAADQSLSIGQTAAATVLVQAAATQGLSVGQSASATVLVAGSATQSLGIVQSAAGTVLVAGSASQALSVGQSATGTVLVQAAADQALSIAQDATASLTVAVADVLESHGGYPEYIPVKRDKRKTLDEERQEIRALLRKALGDEDTPEAAAVVEVARPFVRVPRPGGLKVDWTGIEAHLGELRAALAAYRAAVQDEDDEEDEMMMLAMAA